MEALIAFLTALPVMWKIYTEFQKLGIKDPLDYMRRTHEAMEKAKNAKTEQERIEAAKSIQDVLRG